MVKKIWVIHNWKKLGFSTLLKNISKKVLYMSSREVKKVLFRNVHAHLISKNTDYKRKTNAVRLI